MRRLQGTGTIAQRKSDGMWIARVSIAGTPRIRKSFSSLNREVAEQKLQDWLDANRPDLATVDPQGPRGRGYWMKLAREKGTHSPAQWGAKQREQENKCFYCKRPVGMGGMKDHYVPVSKGGSDGIDNIVLACWDCNATKSDVMPEDFMAWAEETGFYNQPQRATLVNSNGYKLRLSPETIKALNQRPGDRWAYMQRRLALRRNAEGY